MQIERRRAIRYFFGGVAEVVDLDSEKHLIGPASIVSLSGCFVKTTNPFPQGRRVDLKITQGETTFAALGGVADITDEGMGIVFRTIKSSEQSVLEKWLNQTTPIPGAQIDP